MTQTKFKNKLLDSQLRFDKSEFNPKETIKKYLLFEDISKLKLIDDYLILYITNPLKKEILKSYIDSLEILNDTSFNTNIFKIHLIDILKLYNLIDNNKERKKLFEDKVKSICKLKENKDFSLINNINIESIFSTEFSLDPLKSARKLIEVIRSVF